MIKAFLDNSVQQSETNVHNVPYDLFLAVEDLTVGRRVTKKVFVSGISFEICYDTRFIINTSRAIAVCLLERDLFFVKKARKP